MESFENIVNQIDGWIWGIPLIVLLFGTHLFLTYRLKFIQRYIFKAIKLSVTKDDYGRQEGDVSQFSALTTALAGTMGTGNIVGVATAIGIGGPGAVLWVWLTGIFGIATKYSEALLSVKYRVKTKDGTMAGGPMYVLEHGLKSKFGGVAFALFTSIAAFGIGCMVQSNSVSSMVYETFNVPTWITGIVIAALVALVILGGIKKIAKVCEILVPFMALFYFIGLLILLVIGYKTIGSTIALIFRDAFSPQAATGGFAGAGVMMAMRFGISRGLFSNESGLGSAPIVAAAAQTRNPVKQALVSATGTFWDTVVVAALTGITIVNSGFWQKGLEGAALTKAAFSAIPVVGPIMLTIGLITLVFSTILGWSYYGEKAIEYLLGKKAIVPYRIFWVIFIYIGSVFSISLVWGLADIFNALMVIPNLVALLMLSPVIVSETKKYLWNDNIQAINSDPIREIDVNGKIINEKERNLPI
ncbi:MAG: alanine/glycine:cation symporter family protein [Clostridium sp.]|uniref:alanine/glycine:cation symporter family protein n=1 Tax=Clostridium sp. TaxID=1506 RepID=UPI003D6D7E22